jgi:hypothetical protein
LNIKFIYKIFFESKIKTNHIIEGYFERFA